MTDIKDMSALVLCGGLGTRLREIVSDVPKPMASVGGMPFLDFVLDYLGGYGVKKIVLASGYKSEMVRDYYRKNPRGFKIEFSEEIEPLGTAGAVAAAKDKIKSDPFFVSNGDSLCLADLAAMLDFHNGKHAAATIAVAPPPDGAADYGAVTVDADGRIISFNEKSRAAISLGVNAGIYIFGGKIFGLIPSRRPSSLEKEIFPSMKNIYGFRTDAVLADIGTKERFLAARKNLAPRYKQEK